MKGKGGVLPSECIDLVKHILEKCPSLNFEGLMTIGARTKETDVNPDFKVRS